MHSLLRLDNVMYFVSDLDRAQKFYEDALGLKQVWRDEDRKMIGYQMSKSTSEIVIHADPSLPKFDYSFLVKDVVSFCEQVRQAGFYVVRDPFDVRCGKFALLEDQDGNIIPIIDLTAFGGVARYDS